MTNPCPHCKPPEVWPHEHVGNPELPLLTIVRCKHARKEWYFHGTQAQCNAYMDHPKRDSFSNPMLRFEELLLIHKDWDKALEAL